MCTRLPRLIVISSLTVYNTIIIIAVVGIFFFSVQLIFCPRFLRTFFPPFRYCDRDRSRSQRRNHDVLRFATTGPSAAHVRTSMTLLPYDQRFVSIGYGSGVPRNFLSGRSPKVFIRFFLQLRA